METEEQKILREFQTLISDLRIAKGKGDQRSEDARYVAIVITEIEKSLAYYKFFVVDRGMFS